MPVLPPWRGEPLRRAAVHRLGRRRWLRGCCLVDEAYAYRLPDSLDDEHAAPLLCAGIIGYRALRCAAVSPGGRLGIYGFATLAVAGIWLSDIPALNYADELFQERRLRSVTANTRSDGEQLLALAERFAIRASTVAYPMAKAPEALADLAHGRFSGAAVLHN